MAIDVVALAIEDAYDIGIVMSTDRAIVKSCG
jgi:hypothetical protein